CKRLRVDAFFVLKQACLDLAQCDRQWLLAWFWGYQWADELEDAFVLLLVVAIDLTRALGSKDHECVLRRNRLQQLINRRRCNIIRRIEFWFWLGLRIGRGGHVGHMYLF